MILSRARPGGGPLPTGRMDQSKTAVPAPVQLFLFAVVQGSSRIVLT